MLKLYFLIKQCKRLRDIYNKKSRHTEFSWFNLKERSNISNILGLLKQIPTFKSSTFQISASNNCEIYQPILLIMV